MYTSKKVEGFYNNQLFLRDYFALHNQRSKPFLWRLSFESEFFVFWKFMETGGLTIFWEERALILFTLMVYSDGRCRKSA